MLHQDEMEYLKTIADRDGISKLLWALETLVDDKITAIRKEIGNYRYIGHKGDKLIDLSNKLNDLSHWAKSIGE